MAKLVYTAIASLDGYVADRDGNFDWAFPDAEVHAYANDLDRNTGTQLLGRRMYEVMSAWETMPVGPDEPPEINDYASLWHAADKIVYSRTLEAVTTARTELRRDFDPAEVRALKASSERDLGIGGPGLAQHAFAAGLIDECNVILVPVVVGSGTPMLPTDALIHLDLIEERRFTSGFVALKYRVPA